MSGDPRDEIWYETLYDGEGMPHKRLIEQAPKENNDSNFTTYDSSHGHCSLCERLGCRGDCFK